MRETAFPVRDHRIAGPAPQRCATPSAGGRQRPALVGGGSTASGDGEAQVRRLVAAAQAGDDEAMRRLYLAFAPTVQAYVARIVGPHDAEDVTQQVFAKLITRLTAYEPGEAPFAGWLLRVARNLAINHRRRSVPVPCEEVRDRPAADDRRRECTASLLEALGELTPAQRDVLLLRHLVGLSPQEIADRLGRSVRSVHCLHNRGRSAAQLALGNLGAAPATSRPPAGQDWRQNRPLIAA